MGNSLTQEELEQMPGMFYNIMEIPCPNLDIGDKCGSTGYIDFIKHTEIQGAMMKGIDNYGRKFIVWKAMVTIEKPNQPNTIYPTFTTFFKRYQDYSSLVYHACGNHGRNLFSTEGGINLKQMEFLHKLLSTGSCELDYEQANHFRLLYPDNYNYNTELEPLKKDDWVFKINLVDKL